ncbi:potassium transporter TrkG [Alteriqipengyuania flavescens]|uniref:TrkH family potassium uptake protein n=1 Tax=Alteriqipengyuania flavescens TaxID=3053610 RepID=UPI0025B527BD|nr:potassium transporter TrkG [Alteriqipengyuania flavescens]WJY17769.1 potassium transporter TrkG [Alteriqipengyuania flavescens]WJY23711.1 potassium transporter TrkG [Alteriqipengyuania flavescens]
MRFLRNPVRLIPLLFMTAIAIGTLLLWLPIATADGTQAALSTAFFTSTSAVAVTGLIVVDTATYWSPFGKGVILLLFQVGGFGIMTAATLFGLIAGRGFGLRDRMATQVERDRLEVGDARSVLKLVLTITLVAEAVIAAILTARFALAYDMPFAQALWHGVFHSVSAFNNAGFSSFSDSVMSYQSDAAILVPIMLAVIITALGFPVMQDIRAHGLAWRRYSLHSKITVAGTIALLLVGFAGMLAMEWSNEATLAPMSTGAKLLNAAFHAVMPRTAGFNSLDVGAFHQETYILNYGLMFIGGGSAGTAGGIKVTTFAVLAAAVASEIRRERDTAMFGRRIEQRVERQALAIAVMAVLLVTAASIFILATTPLRIYEVLFETISAFATVGLSTGITADLPVSSQVVLCILMFVGRVGTITVATALATGSSERPYRFPKENPIVG